MADNKQVEQVKKEEKKPTKKVRWKFDPNSSMIFVSKEESALADKEARFKFKLMVYKDSESHVESMKITNFVVDKKVVADGDWETAIGKENGSITTSIVDLGRDIKNFKNFGVVIGDTYFRDLARDIEEIYADIEVGEVTLSDDRYKDLINQVEDYIKSSPAEYVTENLCYIPVNMFNELASDCGYSDYEMRNLRGQLAQDKYIYIDEQAGRYAILKRIKDTPKRVIAFYRDKLEVEMPVKQAKEAAVKSDADE